jgi:hypothetical protein
LCDSPKIFSDFFKNEKFSSAGTALKCGKVERKRKEEKKEREREGRGKGKARGKDLQ